MQQINRSIELIRYRRFGDGLLLLELANATNATNAASASAGRATAKAPKDEAPQDSSAANRRVG
ncbi:MAG TPA: DUF91 domain-containing protein, partial [Burkholderiaceae bacterium]|nr:DUF91 domain-containing protein [Burkholderiaceae bacterium]